MELDVSKKCKGNKIYNESKLKGINVNVDVDKNFGSFRDFQPKSMKLIAWVSFLLSKTVTLSCNSCIKLRRS